MPEDNELPEDNEFMKVNTGKVTKATEDNEFTKVNTDKVTKATVIGAGIVGVALIAPIGVAGVVGLGLVGAASSWLADSAADTFKKYKK
jgi:hypothetical protein